MDNEAVTNSIRELCKKHNITPTILEEELGFSQGLISRWKDKSPTLDRVIDIADYFYVPLDAVIGRDSKFKDKFLETIFNKTIDKTLNWQPNFQKPNRKFILPSPEFFDEEIYTEKAYYASFNDGYFIINCFCKHQQTIDPLDLDFYIKPDEKSSLVAQEYTVDELKPLWLAIINNLTEGVPDEIKAENLKQQFLMNITNKKEPV
ncbi:helix-turn-helix domain-containing protein [Lacrimispora indolis]|uniref:helix-turn-helix domain-containing protein n=1 Tax=Lacrimispora indolis TaxID=69825 RepID=UPI0004626FC1|nr:helix-turn-helix transcriptional regulator [[Clostridium] methoxybenzovorans]